MFVGLAIRYLENVIAITMNNRRDRYRHTSTARRRKRILLASQPAVDCVGPDDRGPVARPVELAAQLARIRTDNIEIPIVGQRTYITVIKT